MEDDWCILSDEPPGKLNFLVNSLWDFNNVIFLSLNYVYLILFLKIVNYFQLNFLQYYLSFYKYNIF